MDFFVFLGTELSTSLRFLIIRQWLLFKSLFWFSLTNQKFSVNVRLFLGFPSVEIKFHKTDIKSDSGYRLILYYVVSFIQCELAEIIRWVSIPALPNMVNECISKIN